MIVIRSILIKNVITNNSLRYIDKHYVSSSSSHYCFELVKKNEYENFMCTLVLNGGSRSSCFAIRSFNIELSNALQQTSNQSTGLMRIKFWENALEKCYSKDIKQVPQHPVAIELFRVINESNLTKKYFKSLISSRRDYLSINSFETLESIEKYTEQSVSSLYYLLLEASQVRNLHADHAASHFGKAEGIVRFLRSLPFVRSLSVIPLPRDLLIRHKISEEAVLRGSAPGLTDCVYEVASRAHMHLQKARSLRDRVPGEGRSVLLPSLAVASYLDRLQKCHYDPYHASLRHRPWNWSLRLWLASRTGKY